MSIRLGEKTADLLKRLAGQAFTAREIAEQICQTFPDECQDKKARSSVISTDAELITQISGEIIVNFPKIQKRDSGFKTTEGRPRKFYWTELSDEAEAEQSADHTVNNTGQPSRRESDLYPLLSQYLRSELGIYSKRIDERRSENIRGRKGNRWLYPDVVGMEDLSEDWHEQLKAVVKEYGDRRTTLWSFEVKMVLNSSNIREAFSRLSPILPGRISVTWWRRK